MRKIEVCALLLRVSKITPLRYPASHGAGVPAETEVDGIYDTHPAGLPIDGCVSACLLMIPIRSFPRKTRNKQINTLALRMTDNGQ